MSRKALRLSGVLSFFLCALVPVRAQESEVPVLKVEVKCDTCGLNPQYTLELYDIRGREKVDSADLQTDGAFTLHHIPYGDYQMTITDSAGAVLHQEFLTASRMTPSVTVHLEPPVPQRPPDGPVSVAQLQHPPARKALQGMLAAQKLSLSGDYQKAADELEKAIRISPYCSDAYTNLAVQHMHLHRFQEATDEFRKALELGGPNPLVLTDLASAQMSMKQYNEAAKMARWALRLDPGYPQAHYVLGMILSTDTRTVREGLEHLHRAAESIPSAENEIEKVHKAMAQAGM